MAGVEFFAINQEGKAPGFEIFGIPVPTTAQKIHAFLNDRGPGITKVFEDNAIHEFRIYDPAGENWRIGTQSDLINRSRRMLF